jgi:hypothetical protein
MGASADIAFQAKLRHGAGVGVCECQFEVTLLVHSHGFAVLLLNVCCILF